MRKNKPHLLRGKNLFSFLGCLLLTAFLLGVRLSAGIGPRRRFLALAGRVLFLFGFVRLC